MKYSLLLIFLSMLPSEGLGQYIYLKCSGNGVTMSEFENGYNSAKRTEFKQDFYITLDEKNKKYTVGNDIYRLGKWEDAEINSFTISRLFTIEGLRDKYYNSFVIYRNTGKYYGLDTSYREDKINTETKTGGHCIKTLAPARSLNRRR